MSCLCTGFRVRAKTARAEAARRHGTHITCRAVRTKKAARENPTLWCKTTPKTSFEKTKGSSMNYLTLGREGVDFRIFRTSRCFV